MVKICGICGKKNTINVVVLPYTENKKKSKTYEQYDCCNYIKQQGFLSAKELSKLYSSSYLGYRKSKLWQLLKSISTDFRVSKYKTYIQGKDILELGSGMGDFISACTKLNPKSVAAVEISAYACKHIKKNNPEINIINSNIEDYSDNKKYNTIFLFHVIEHVKDPAKLIKNCKKMLSKDGTIIIETPNYNSWDRFIFGNKWFNYQVPYHTYLFSPLSLTNLSKRLGLHAHFPEGSKFPNTFSVQFKDIQGGAKIFLPIFLVLYFLVYFVGSFFMKSGVFSIKLKNRL